MSRIRTRVRRPRLGAVARPHSAGLAATLTGHRLRHRRDAASPDAAPTRRACRA